MTRLFNFTHASMAGAIFVTLALLSACVPNYAEKPAAEIRAAVKTEYNKADATVTLLAPPIRTTKYNTQLSEYDYFTAYLRGWKGPTGIVVNHQLYVVAQYSDAYLRSYRSAYFDEGQTAGFTQIGNRLHGCRLYHIMPILCDFEEVFGVALTTEFLERHKVTGLSVRINAQSVQGTFIRLPSNYIQGYLAAVADVAERRE